MTTPSERRRALRWGHEALLAIGEDAGAPGSLRSQAMTLAAAYPSLRELGTSFLELSAEELNQRLNVLVQTKALLVQAIRCDGLSAATRRNVIVTDRHFVEAHEINIKSQDTDDQRNAAKQWVDFYLLRDLDAVSLAEELSEQGIEDVADVCASLEAMGPPDFLGRRGVSRRRT